MSETIAIGGTPKWLRRIGALATSTPVRIVVSGGLLAVLGTMIDWQALVDGLEGAAWGWFALAVGLFFSAFTIGAVRWRALLLRASLPVRFASALRATLIGLFSNNFLPTGYGGEAVRAWIVGRSGKSLARAFASVGVDRASGFVCLLVLAWIAVIVKVGGVPSRALLLLALASAGFGLAGVLVLVAIRRRGLGRFLPNQVRPWGSEVMGVLRTYARDRALLMQVVAIGLAYQFVAVLGYWLIAKSLGLDLDPTTLALVVPTVLLAALLPISIAGLGVREGAFVVLLAPFGVSAADATLMSLLALSAGAIASSPGGIAIVYDPGRRPGRADASVGGP